MLLVENNQLLVGNIADSSNTLLYFIPQLLHVLWSSPTREDSYV